MEARFVGQRWNYKGSIGCTNQIKEDCLKYLRNKKKIALNGKAT